MSRKLQSHKADLLNLQSNDVKSLQRLQNIDQDKTQYLKTVMSHVDSHYQPPPSKRISI